jgi:chromosome segregation ATPase
MSRLNAGSPLKLQQTDLLDSPFGKSSEDGGVTGEGYANYMKAKGELDEVVKDLDVKLNRVLAKQEYEYLKGYNVYVRQKEKELKATIQQLSERFNNQGTKEKKILSLQQAIKAIRDEQIIMDRDNVQLREKVKQAKRELGEANQEREFYEKKTKDVKKKNQLLKVAILRLQNEVETLKAKVGVSG